MTTPAQLLRSRFRAIEGGCVTCAGDLAGVESLPGVSEVDALASGLVLVTHDGTVTDESVVEAARRSGVPLVAAGPARRVLARGRR